MTDPDWPESSDITKFIQSWLYLLSTSASMKMTSQIPQEDFLDFFVNNSTWSLLKFLKYRAGTESFTYEKDKEHLLYRSALISISTEQAQTCLLTFEPAGFVLAGERGVHLPSAPLNILHVSCHDATDWKRERSSKSVGNFWNEIEKNRLNDNIEKSSLEYINETISDAVKDSKTARNYLSDELESFVTNSKKRDCSLMENSQDQSNFHIPDHNKKTRKDMSNVSFDEYINAINAVNSIQNNNESAHTNPLWWGVLDFREENLSPSPSLPRAKNFLSANEVNRLMKALLLSEIVSLQLLAKECGARGIVGVHDLLQRFVNKMQDVDDKKIIQDNLANVDADDDTTIYVGKYIEDTYEWICRFHGQCQSERTVDMFLVGPCAKTPQTIFTYGENHSDADRDDKTARSQNSRVGKSCDFLYWSSSREVGIGENSGPTHKDNHDKARTDFVDVIKVCRAQHIELMIQMIEQSGRNPLPESLQKAMASILIPFYHIIGMRIRFYLLFQISGDLYGIWDWASEYLPTKDADVGEIALLCKRFLVHGYLIERVGRMTNILAKKAKTFKDKKDKITGASEPSQPIVELNKFRTPVKDKKSAK
ncbi:9928_t:CDS:10 [Cetraspora pellucida]|uniref:9928_t:CDS:1 n=1 Tax=Cetraspora pellucida TaxID=1433469 RepID=A0A9N9HWS6_9GLOM|nr:9928_t:CDS:10 [Cetraspora pellucida]